MDCAQLEAHLTDFLEGELDPSLEAEAVEHLATCQRCELVLAGTRAVIATAAHHGRVAIGSERAGLLRRILAELGPADSSSGERQP
ncbi:MAG: zf-HC2 domain-containing protein [Ilumatobacteraceae bacterium]